MSRIALALLLSLGATVATAQASDVPKLNCGAKPDFPGRLASDTQRKNFDRIYKVYDTCVKAYVEERKNAIKANEVAAQLAIDEYNALVQQLRADQGQSPADPSKPESQGAPTYK